MWRDARLSWPGVAEKQSPLHGSSHQFLQTVSRNVHMYSVSSWILRFESELEGISNLQFACPYRALISVSVGIGKGSASFRTVPIIPSKYTMKQNTSGSSLGVWFCHTVGRN